MSLTLSEIGIIGPLAAVFYQTVEFYVAAAVVAAAVVAACVKPTDRSAVKTHLMGGELTASTPPMAESIEMEALPGGDVVLRRRGVANVGCDGAVSIVVAVNGFDITIDERVTPGTSGQNEVVDAEFLLDFMGAERYFVRYNSDVNDSFATLTFTNREGVKMERELRR